jgi:hypothetical protein
MSTNTSLVFPDLILLEDHSGDFQSYIKNVYSVFANDFLKDKPYFEGQKVTAARYPEVDGMSRTFYHITHEGEDERNRVPDFRRMERIRFPRFKIENVPNDELLVWEKTIKRDVRVHILNVAQSYILVLNKRKGYFMLWTAFYINQKHQMRKKLKEYETFINAKTA